MSSPDVRVILPSRLGEIFQARERAYAQRDETVLDTIYTADCTCLRSGRAATARVRADSQAPRVRAAAATTDAARSPEAGEERVWSADERVP